MMQLCGFVNLFGQTRAILGEHKEEAKNKN